MRLPHWMGHRWGRWQSYVRAYQQRWPFDPTWYDVAQTRQRRQCLTCGIQQDILLSDGAIAPKGVEENLQRERVETKSI